MARWKLIRQTFGSEEFEFSEGEEVSIGRGINNTICLSSLVISRKHCLINVYSNKITVKDLGSSNGTFVGSTKIPVNEPVPLKHSDILSIGWSSDAALVQVEDKEKFVFKLVKEILEKPIIDRFAFQTDTDDFDVKPNVKTELMVTNNLKRKSNDNNSKHIAIQGLGKTKTNEDVVNLVSDSDNENINSLNEQPSIKKIKLESINEEETNKQSKANAEIEEVFKVKQEYQGYDEELICLDSDSDDESDRWLMRLSQSSPGKPHKNFINGKKLSNSSYSQNDDELDISQIFTNDEDLAGDIIILPEPQTTAEGGDEIDGVQGITSDFFSKQLEESLLAAEPNKTAPEKPKIQIIEPPSTTLKSKLNTSASSSSKSSTRHSTRSKRQSSSKRPISNSQKEERKKRLRDIATKTKDAEDKEGSNSPNNSKSVVNAKVTTLNRGAFLTELVTTTKVSTKKESSKQKEDKKHSDKSESKHKESKHGKKTDETISKNGKTEHKESRHGKKSDDAESGDNKKTENESKDAKRISAGKTKEEGRDSKKSRSKHSKEDADSSGSKKKKDSKEHSKKKDSNTTTEEEKKQRRVTVINVHVTSIGGTSVNKSKKPKKTVRFSTQPPQVRLFEIEPGNQMRETKSIKSTLLDMPQMKLYSLEKIMLTRILKWNPHWLDEQANINDPPPILGHNNPPSIVFQTFKNHSHYVHVIGDLLLMEIWECITQAYLRKRNQENFLQMRVENVPPLPDAMHSNEIFSISVNLSLPRAESNSLPRMGELMMVTFGPDNNRIPRFFYVHNIRCLPSPPTNMYAFYSISLQTTFTEKLRVLRQGEVVLGKPLSYIKNELALFDAMEYLARSPLSEAILRPSPEQYTDDTTVELGEIRSQWTNTLNDSQLEAVSSVITAALTDKCSLQLIQGPPGTGKSSVICSTIMTYFYDSCGRRRSNRRKVLVCATSNAAVDELVIRLLNIRQTMPKNERFRMVRFGRPEAMHPRAKDLSSQSLAARDLTAAQNARGQNKENPPLLEEIGHQEARLNMWRTTAEETNDPARIAYCQTRIKQINERIAQLRSLSGGGTVEPGPEAMARAERRIIECADIVVTTLASAANNKMRGLKRSIALCIVDEAGQAIEPESLAPLTLLVPRLTLIGDPQQLPGFICSQRAKKHGLGESLFARLSSTMEQWGERNPVILLNVQYRMHPAIADYPNRAFYGGCIRNANTPSSGLLMSPYSVVFISSGDRGQDGSGANEMEALAVCRLAMGISAATRAQQLSVAVITPYAAHKDLVRRTLRQMQEPGVAPIEVNTVDSFQGQERDVVIVSLARSQGVGFLTDAGRINVMLTRAKQALIVCLNPHALNKNPQWRTLIDDAKNRKLCQYLPPKYCSKLLPSRDPDDIIKFIQNDSK